MVLLIKENNTMCVFKHTKFSVKNNISSSLEKFNEKSSE